MLEQRRTRAQESREVTAPRITKWAPPSNLPDPDPRPGWKHRWCAVTLNNEVTPTINRRFAEGWQKCLASEYPEVTGKIINVSKDGSIETGGMILCRADVALIESRDEYHRNLNREQLMGVRQETARSLNEESKYGGLRGEDFQQSATENSARRLEFGDGK